VTDHGFFLNAQAEAGDVCVKPQGNWPVTAHDRMMLGNGTTDGHSLVVGADKVGIRGDFAQVAIPRSMAPYRATMDELDQKLIAAFDGKVLRKDCCTGSRKAPTSRPSSWSSCWPGFAPATIRRKWTRAWKRCWPACRTTTSNPTRRTRRSRRWRPRASTVSSTRCMSAMSRRRSATGLRPGELQLAAHRHRRKVLSRQRSPAGGGHLGGSDADAQPHRGRRLRFLHRGSAADPDQPLRLLIAIRRGARRSLGTNGSR
jgi:hypothetical protein